MTSDPVTVILDRAVPATRSGDTRARIWGAGSWLPVSASTAALLVEEGAAHLPGAAKPATPAKPARRAAAKPADKD